MLAFSTMSNYASPSTLSRVQNVNRRPTQKPVQRNYKSDLICDKMRKASLRSNVMSNSNFPGIMKSSDAQGSCNDLIVAFLSSDNVEQIQEALNQFDPKIVKKIMKKWSVLTNMDNTIDLLPSLPDLNMQFIGYCNSLVNSEMEWDEKLLKTQYGYWRDQKPNRDPPAFFHPLSVIEQNIVGNPAYIVSRYDEYESQGTERDNNLYQPQHQKLPQTYKQIKVAENRGTLSPYDIFTMNKRSTRDH